MATRRADEAAQAQARARMERTGEVPASGLGGAWTPWPGMLFLADQALHMTFAIVGWLVILEGAPLIAPWVDFVNLVLRGLGPGDRPRRHPHLRRARVAVRRQHAGRLLLRPGPRVAARAPARDEPPARGADRNRGRGAGTLSPPRRPVPRPPRVGPAPSVPSGAPARIGATIGALERLLIVDVHPRRLGGRGRLRHRGQDDRPVQAARRPRLRGVLPAGHARERVRGDRSGLPGARGPQLTAVGRAQTRLRGIASRHSRSKNGSPSSRTSRRTRTSKAPSSDAISPCAPMSMSKPSTVQR